jgi:hypothetical protein
MNQAQIRNKTTSTSGTRQGVEMKLEVIVIPVSDVNRAKQFYVHLG